MGCWILETDPEVAFAKATFQVSKYDWLITGVETPPIEVTQENFVGEDIGAEQYAKAQQEGLAFFYVGWARDKKTSVEPITIRPSFKPNVESHLRKQKQEKNRGRCLHYDGGVRCREYINAHSIQKNQALSAISRDGHVYTPSANMTTLRENRGAPAYELNGIGTVSTFLGFCKKHDNELFAPIDNSLLLPTNEQVFLYAYRSICREVFVKDNALNLITHKINDIPANNFLRGHLEAFKAGTEIGFKNLKRHKSNYDDSLRKSAFNDIKHALFTFKGAPPIAFSGLFYPDYDFKGTQLQYLADHRNDFDLITFCSAPMAKGWGFLFAWHHTSSQICNRFLSSLFEEMSTGSRVADMLFRLVISACENHAISPIWWEQLPKDHKEEISRTFGCTVSSFSPTKATYLAKGLEGIAEWDLSSVITNTDLAPNLR
ncbi:hypothetical protein GeomeDRAFT_1520 [Geobacter metallireducens RCH3]|nr:hypothetical protein GeomeDRAFT_1520 [Geobacter metallireducens RCH3]